MKIRQESKTRTLLPYTTFHVIVNFEGSMEEWEKVKGDILPKIEIG